MTITLRTRGLRLYALALTLACWTFSAISPAVATEPTEAPMKIARMMSMNMTGIDENGMPESIRLEFSVEGDMVILNLTISQSVKSKAPVYVGRDNGVVQKMDIDILDKFAVYTDNKKGASFLYRTHRDEDGTSKKKFTGSFRMGNEDYKIEPATTSAQHERVRRAAAERANPGDTYIVYPDVEVLSYDRDYLNRREENPSSEFAQELVEYYQAPPTNGKQIYFVETFFILDYGMYNRWWNLAQSSESYSRDIETINNIRYYFTHVANGVDMRYRSIEESDYAITVKLTGFYIAATPSAARWSEAYRESDGRRLYVEAYKMLDDIIKWIEDSQRDGKLPNFDQATMFTGYSLFNGYNSDGRRRTLNGLADIEGVCSKYKVSVNVDKGSYAATQTSAHEMGHGLGAIHDGPNNNCESRSQYIMAISPGGLTSRNFDNVFRFSPCSRHEIRLHLTYLRMQGKNCLMNPAENADQAEIDAHLERLPGQIFSPDDQCRYVHGPNGYYCGGQVADEGICHALVCYNPLTRKCSSSVEQRAANGTTCGNGKWCKFGKCVPDAGAPATEDYCMSGDSRAVLSDKTRCEDINLTTWKCYMEHFREPCCASCLAAKDESNSRCIYGDKVSWCHNIRRSDCYNSRTREQCCQTCAEYKSDKFDRCEYGDRASWCNNMKISSCYANRQTCCESCGERQEENDRTGRYPSNCAFGDRASWCTDHRSRPWQCYISAHTCCATCNDVATGIPGCEYGDKMSGCYNADCTDNYYQRRCCATCMAYNGLTRPPPTTRRTTTRRPTTTPTTTPRPTTTRPTTRPTTRRTTGPSRTVTTTVGPTNPVQKCIMQGRDLATWCQDRNLFKGICYTSAHICCVTCAMADRGTEQCRYGDMISWCPQIDPGACYTPKTENQCCDTCDRHRNDNRPECRYGDQYKWCRRESSRCHEADIREKCCHTCANYKSTTTATTTKGTTTTTTTTTTPIPGATPDPTTTSSTTTPSTTTTTTSPTTTRPSTTTPVRATVSPIECPDGDSASWCPTIPSSYCYTSEHTCCATCQARLISNDKECRYGDRFTWCSKLSASRCSEENIQRDCCLLCKEQKTTGFNPPPLCGEDQAGWCADIHHRECYQASTKETCCKTCQDNQVDESGCAYGDHAEWCSADLASYECYKFGDTCCDTCRSLYSTGVSGCEYGDKTPVCEGLDCTDAQIRDLCCETCSKQAKVTAAVATTTPRPEPEDGGCIEDSVSWCRTIKSLHCYADQDVCCRTCLKFYLGFRGCEYGDRVSWCASTIKKAADCERSDIGDNCCYTCALMGTPSTRENPEEWREGVLVGFLKKDMSKIIAEEMDMLMFLSHQVNEFCLDNPSECCLHLYDNPESDKTDLAIPEILVDETPTPKQRQNLRIVLPSDCHIAGGYPRHSENNEGEIVTKYLVKLRPEALEPLCGGPQGHDADKASSRKRRDTETRERTIYFNKHKLREMIVHNKDVIESAMGVHISRVTLSGELQSTGFKVVVGIAAGALIAFIVVAIILVITIRKLLKMKKEKEKPSDKRQLYPPSTLWGFRPGKNKVRHWDQMSDSLSSFASTGMTSPVYVANEKLRQMPYVTSSESYVTDSGKDLYSESSGGTLTSPSPPPSYHSTPGYGSDYNVGWTNQHHIQHDTKNNDIENQGDTAQNI